MKEITLTLGGSILTALIVLVVFLAIEQKETPAGSVAVSSEYFATTTGEVDNLERNLSVDMLLKSRSGVLGSITITGANTGELFVYDATTTDNTLRANTSTSSIERVHIPASAAAGTYVFDAVFNTGIVVDEVGTTPTSTILYR